MDKRTHGWCGSEEAWSVGYAHAQERSYIPTVAEIGAEHQLMTKSISLHNLSRPPADVESSLSIHWVVPRGRKPVKDIDNMHSQNVDALDERLTDASRKMVPERLLDTLFLRGRKFFTFSQFVTMLEVDSPSTVSGVGLSVRGYKRCPLYHIEGSAVLEHGPETDLFQQPVTRRLGIDLTTAANTVVFYDKDWNPDQLYVGRLPLFDAAWRSRAASFDIPALPPLCSDSSASFV
ncbi:hypothetical protein EDB85DRAFT_2150346 [Lactarius pseudohatsudake]|nr:hypothetical protein EDB85DRAFT_2150346 [Lactarius pseudohatsudake]